MPNFGLFVAVAFLYFYNLGINQVWQPNEAFYADASKNMLKSGDFLTPVYNGELRLNKPPLTYWLTALSFSLFGVSELTLRLFQALAGLGTGLITYMIAKKLSDNDTAQLSFLILTLSFQFIANARYTSPEVLLTFFITLSLYLWVLSYERKDSFLFFLALTSSALGVLTKGPVGFLIPAGVVFTYLLFRDRRELLKVKYYLGTLYVMVISGWWFAYQYLVNGGEFVEVFLKENVKRIYAMREDPIYSYVLDINWSFLPYSFLFFIALFWAIRRRRTELYFPLAWFSLVFVVFSLVKMKLPLYIMPAFPAMAIITARFLSAGEWKKLANISSIFLTLLMVFAIWLIAFTLVSDLVFLLVCSTVPLLFLFVKRFPFAPAVGGFSLLFYVSAVLLPEVEKYRPYRNIGDTVRELDKEGKLKTYELGIFHHSLPFYADRVIIKGAPREGERALVLAKKGALECEPVKVWSVYEGSESRFIKFLRDVKRGRNFYELELCILGEGS
ncbi:MAG TPA: glycosyltransferase family 39 protein [Aquifex aeolicus]|nr:glycosyltransferase family 39 protein [Aquifex aeolicus]